MATWLVVLLSLLVFLGGATGGYLYRQGVWPWSGASGQLALQPLPLPKPGAQDEDGMDAVVHVQPKGSAGTKQGLGFFVDANGLLLTAAHVVDGEPCVIIQSQDGRKYSGTVLGADRVLDVAMVRVSSTGAPRTFVPLASDALPDIGTPVTIVNDADKGGGWATQHGKIDRQALDLSVDGRYLQGLISLTDVQAAPGMSGGPVVNERTGKAVGFLVAGTTSGAGYAMPLQKVTQRLAEWSAMATPTGCQPSPASATTEVQFATISPLSGLMGVWGSDVADGAELALREMDAELKAVGLHVTLRRLDDGGDPAKAKEQAALIAADPRVVGVVGSLTNPLSEAVQAGLASSKQVLIIPATPAETPAKAQGRPPFRLVPSVQQQMTSLLTAMQQQEPVKTAMLVSDGTVLGEERVKLFGEVAARAGVHVVDRISLAPDVSLATVAQRITEQKPDLIYFGGSPATLREALAQISTRPWRLAGGAELADRGFETLPPAVTDGMSFPYPVSTPSASFSSRFQTVLGRPTAGLSAYGYDAARLVLDGLVAWGADHPGQAPDGDQLYQWIHERTHYQGVTGRFGFGPNGENGEAAIPIYRWSGGALQLVTKG